MNKEEKKWAAIIGVVILGLVIILANYKTPEQRAQEYRLNAIKKNISQELRGLERDLRNSR